MKPRIPKRFKLFKDTSKIIKQGSSNVILIPSLIMKTLKLETGDSILIYSDGDGLLLIDLKPNREID